MAVYLLHFATPVAPGRHTAQHYIGFAKGGDDGVARRLKKHKSGRGGRLPAVAMARGIEIHVARTWPEGDQAFERWLKNKKGARVICPLCSGPGALQRAIFQKPADEVPTAVDNQGAESDNQDERTERCSTA